jgi:hypothetical protein
MADYFGYFDLQAKRIYFVAFVGFSNVWKRRYWPRLYIKRSLEDAFCNARLRTYEISMPIINEAYQNKMKPIDFSWFSFNKCQYIICVPVGGAFFTFKQMKKYLKQKQDLSLAKNFRS